MGGGEAWPNPENILFHDTEGDSNPVRRIEPDQCHFSDHHSLIRKSNYNSILLLQRDETPTKVHHFKKLQLGDDKI